MIVADYILPVLPIDENTSRVKCIDIMMDNLCFEFPVLRKGKLYGTRHVLRIWLLRIPV